MSFDNAIYRLKAICYSKGPSGLFLLGRLFLTHEDGHMRYLEYGDFEKALTEFGLKWTRDEIRKIFNTLDKDKTGKIDYDELLFNLRQPIHPRRINLVEHVFFVLDKDRDNKISIHDFKGIFTAKYHTKFVNGEWNELQVFVDYLSMFDVDHFNKRQISRDEFVNFYCGHSAFIEDDSYFDLMIRQTFKLN